MRKHENKKKGSKMLEGNKYNHRRFLGIAATRQFENLQVRFAYSRSASAVCTPATAMPPSPTAAAQRLTEPERTSPAAKMAGRLVSSGLGGRLFSFQAGAFATSVPVLINPFSSRSISSGSHSVHGVAPIMEKIAGVRTTRRSPVFVSSSSASSSILPPDIFRICV